jgi:polyketide synthase PksN
MLSILNTLCHGYVAIPVIQVCRKRRLFARWGVGKGIRFQTLARRAGANPGYLRIALSMLEALGWVSRNDDTYYPDRKIDFDIIPEGILGLYQIAPEDMFDDTAAQVKLAQGLRALRNRPADSDDIAILVEGALLLPILIALRQTAVSGHTPLPRSLHAELKRELCGLFVEKGWGNQTGDVFSFSTTGTELIERAYVMAIAVSYRPMLARMEELLFGNSAAVFARDDSARESHIDRRLNVIASGFQHQRYFMDAEHHLLSIFDDLPLAEQPRYIADIGCGDGTFLKHLHEAICTKTRRGQSLTQYPLLVIGVDYNQAALIETEKTLKELPHLTFTGDISDPQQIVNDLRKHGIADPENVLYLRSFLDHNFRYKAAPRARQDFGDELSFMPGSHYVDAKGRAVAGKQILNAWRTHLQRWAVIANRHGLVLLEAHCLPPSLSQRYFERTESFYFDAVHALSGQYLLEAESFFVVAASVGLFPAEPPVRYPKTLPFCRITLSHLEKRDYVVRHAQLRDLDALLDMESRCWAPELQTPRREILRRLKGYPQGQFVLEMDESVVGVIYSQRIQNEQLLQSTTVDLVGRLHRDDGPIVQLLALNVLPAFQGRNLGDQLLSFMLHRCSVMNGVEKVVGVTVCKDYISRDGGASFIEYVRSRDEHGALLDPNLRFHEFHGATIGEVIEGFRPKDVQNETRGILIHYDIYNLKRRARFRAEAAATKRDHRQLPETDGDLRHLVASSIRRCLGERKASAYAPDRPLMEMGLDSADLLELNELLSSQLNLSLEPAFFFEHNTSNRIVTSLGSRIVGAVGAATNLFLSSETSSHETSGQLKVDRSGEKDGVAIIGVALRLPGGMATLEDLWRLLKDGGSAIGRLPEGRWQWPTDIDPLTRHAGIDLGGFLERIDTFDAGFFRISPKEAELMDPQQRILLELGSQAIEDAGYSRESLAGSKTGVFIGASGSDYLRLLDNSGIPVDAHFGTGNSMAILANRLSYFFDFSGPSLQIDTACSSSLVALHSAMQSLRTGECSQALVGGIHLMCHPANTIAYYNAGMLSRSGACRTFDTQADGYVRSEGALMILIKPLKAAEEEGDSIYAVIRGTAINHGGQASGLTVPNPEKQAKLLQAAWKAAGVSPSSINYIEMHGTGTPLGDPIEVDGIQRAFSRAAFNGSSCGLGSVKTNLGHLEAAAGLAGLLKVVLCLRYRELFATVHLAEINRHIHLENGALYVVRECQDWPKPPTSDRRRAGVSSFGFGGANAHAVLEEYVRPRRALTDAPLLMGAEVAGHPAGVNPRPSLPISYPGEPAGRGENTTLSPVRQPLLGLIRARGPYLFVLSAKTAERLHAYATRYLLWLSKADGEVSLEDLTYTLQVGRQAMESRLALVAEDIADLVAKLNHFCGGLKSAEGSFHNTIGFDGVIKSSSDATVRDGEVKVALAKRDLVAIAQLWTSGVSIPWKTLHRDPYPRRIHLPTYPFAPVSHWFKPHEPSHNVRPASTTPDTILHPLVQRNTSNALPYHFTSTFSGQEFFLSDHRIDGCRTLPGVATIEMVRSACEIATGAQINATSGLQFSSVIWTQPVQVGARLQTVHIKLSPNGGDGVRYEISSESETSTEGRVVHGQGTVMASRFDSIPRLDLLRLQEQTRLHRVDSVEFYNHFREEGILYGPGHQGISEMFFGTQQALARIVLPSSVAATARDYQLHPSIVDSALQAGIAFRSIGNPRKANPLLPFSVESIEVYAGTRDSMWAWVRYGDDEGHSSGQLPALDVDLCDESGIVCVRFKKLSARRARERRVMPAKEGASILSESHAPSPAPIMIKPVWTPCHPLAKPSSGIHTSLRVLVFGADKHVLPAVKKVFPNSVFAQITDWSEPALIASLGEFGEIDQIVWFAAAPLEESIADQRIIDRQSHGVLGLFNLIKALLQQGYGAKEIAWTLCTTQTLAVDTNDRVDPTNAGIQGLVGSMAKEYPNWRVRLIDLEAEWSEPLSSLFYLPYEVSGNPIAYRRGQWFRREFIPVRELSGSGHRLRKNGTYVVIGGAGGIGKEWSRWLIERYQARLIWIGRRKKDASLQRSIDELKAFGPAPYYISADATDRRSLQAAYDEVKTQFPKINGVVHSAIVLKDSSLANMTVEQFIASLEANVDVCVRIAEVFNPDTLDFLLFFSSIQSFSTFGGQSNYAAGCTFKDAFAHRLRQDCSSAVKVVNWGYWGSVGVVASAYYRESMAL